MKLVFLGVGGWISKPILGHTSVLVEYEGDRLLLDAGEGVARALYLYTGRIPLLKGIVVTHLHGDHVLGLPTLLMLLKYSGARGVKVYAPTESTPGLEALLKITGVDYEDVAEIVGVEPGTNGTLGSFRLKFTRAVHTMPAISARVETDGKCIAYSGDTSYNPALVDLSRDCDVLIHEASGYDTSAHQYGHSTVEDAIRVASEAGVQTLVLVHYYLEAPHLELRAEGSRLRVYVAYPGFELNL